MGFWPSGRAAYCASWSSGRATYMGFKLPNLSSCIVDINLHALKGQKLLAQGNALGIMSVSNAPCKGKSFKIHLIKMENPLRYVKLLPLQGARFATHKKPRAMPWARSFCPFRACCLYGSLGWCCLYEILDLFGRAAYKGFLAFWACCLYELLITQHAYSF